MSDIATLLALYFPVGVVGGWRWSVWFFKVLVGLRYRPATAPYESTVSVVTPVYNEQPDVFLAALRSWARSRPQEIIAVIDHTDASSIEVFRKFSEEFSSARLLVTEKPGKRPALADGIREARSDIVALVDSDTIWADELLTRALCPFRNPKIGGVAASQRVLAPQTFAQKIFDIQLHQRYVYEVPFLAALGGPLRCLSGRTALYRRSAVLPLLDDLVGETFWGKPVISGEDKRLTYLVQAAGWKTTFQGHAEVYTPGMATLSAFLRQRLRWARNSWRADLRAVGQRWAWKQPLFALTLIDGFLQPFALLLGPMFLLITLAHGQWGLVLVVLLWWYFSRLVKLAPTLAHRPRYAALLPEYTVVNILFAVTKIYALFTLNRQSWITRWDKSRLPVMRFSQTLLASTATSVLFLAFLGVSFFLQQAIVTRAALATIIQIPDLSPRLSLPHAPVGASPSAALAAEASPVVRGKARATYDAASWTIHVRGRGQRFTLSTLRSLVGTNLLAETAPGQWDLHASIHLHTGTRLELLGDEVRHLRLASGPGHFVWIMADSASIRISGVHVTSWDSSRNGPDVDVADGRSFLLLRNAGRMDILDAELAYLGYSPALTNIAGDATFGVAWKATEQHRRSSQPQPTGHVARSRFHHNYFGAYLHGVAGMQWEESSLVDNVRYGLVLDTETHDVQFERSRVADNASHGIVLTESAKNTFEANTVSGNRGHAFVLQSAHENALVANRVEKNGSGMALTNARTNLIVRNQVTENGHAVQLFRNSRGNAIEHNVFTDHRPGAIRVYAGADENIVRRNELARNTRALHIASQNNDIYENRISDGLVAVTLAASASGNTLFANEIRAHRGYALQVKTVRAARNFVSRNTFAQNRRDIGTGIR